jgi:hypothetical protein
VAHADRNAAVIAVFAFAFDLDIGVDIADLGHQVGAIVDAVVIAEADVELAEVGIEFVAAHAEHGDAHIVTATAVTAEDVKGVAQRSRTADEEAGGLDVVDVEACFLFSILVQLGITALDVGVADLVGGGGQWCDGQRERQRKVLLHVVPSVWWLALSALRGTGRPASSPASHSGSVRHAVSAQPVRKSPESRPEPRGIAHALVRTRHVQKKEPGRSRALHRDSGEREIAKACAIRSWRAGR